MRIKISISKALILIIGMGILIRMINLGQPLLEGASTRQVQTAMIARNFYNHGFKLFYPQVDNFGNNPGYLMLELYILPFIAAIFYKLAGGVNEWMLRCISIFFYAASAIMLYRLSVYYFNKKIGLIAVFCFTVSPLSIYLGRAVHPEMAMTFFSMAAIYSFSRWIYEDKIKYGIFAVFSFVLAVLLKIPNLYLLLPLFFIAFTKYNLACVKKPRILIFLALCFIPIALFNRHQYLVRMAFPNPAMEVFNLGTILGYIRLFLSDKMFYKASFDNLAAYTLTPIGFSLFFFGFLQKVKEKKERVFKIWFLGVVIFFLSLPAQSVQGYYQMHLLPLACIFIARAVHTFKNSEVVKQNYIIRPISVIILILVVSFVVFRYSYAFYRIPANFRSVVEAGREVDRVAEKDALIIASIENGPDLVYYSNRRGWPFMINREAVRNEEKRMGKDKGRIYDPVEYLEFLRSEGADYFASASMAEFGAHKKFSGYMRENFQVLKEAQNYIIFDIRKKK